MLRAAEVVPVPAGVVVVDVDVVGVAALGQQDERLGGILLPYIECPKSIVTPISVMPMSLNRQSVLAAVSTKQRPRVSLGLYSTKSGISGL